jgi:histidyl-tRNA synthetase
MSDSTIGLVPGTRDWLPHEFDRLTQLERELIGWFTAAGYQPLRTPLLEYSELHERKSGAGVVAKLVEVSDDQRGGLCLRPELTASIVRAYVAALDPPALPWRVCGTGVVFRNEALRPGVAREFAQVGVELLGAGGEAADAEVIALAVSALRSGPIEVANPVVRVGHLGLILEVLARSGLPPGAQAALVEILSEAATEGSDVQALEEALDRLSTWLGGKDEDEALQLFSSVGEQDAHGLDRLFRHVMPQVTGRRTTDEILGRLRRKWELGHSLADVLARLRPPIQALAELRGPANEVLARLRQEFGTLAPSSVASLGELMRWLEMFGVERECVRLDLGLSRGIGFYSQMIFAIEVPGDAGPVEVCGGGRYDGLARVFGSNRDARGVGFAIGLERLASVVSVPKSAELVKSIPSYLVVPATAAWQAEAVACALHLREVGNQAVLALESTTQEALAQAKNHCLKFVLVVGGPFRREGSLQVASRDDDWRGFTPAPLTGLLDKRTHFGAAQ